MADLEQLILDVTCNYCGASDGYWCKTKSGRVANSLHGARSWAVYQAYGQGYTDGDRDGRAWQELLR